MDSSVARAPRSCSELNAERYASANRGSSTRSPNRSRLEMKASGSPERCRCAIDVSESAQPVDHLDRLALLVDALGVARPARDHSGGMRDLTAGLELRAHHRQQPLRDAVRALGAQPRDRVAHLRVREALDQRRLVLLDVHPRHGRQRRRALAGPCSRAGTPGTADPAPPRGRAGSRPDTRSSRAPGARRSSSRSFISSYGSTSSTTCTPASSYGGRPKENESSSTHCVNGSHTTGQRSSTPNRSRTSARSSSVVTGVIRSTIELGKRTSRATHAPSSGSRSEANAVNARRDRWPLPCRLSHDMTVNGSTPARAPAPQRLDDQTERATRHSARLQVGLDVPRGHEVAA